jgi:hypothetical protein
VILKKNSCKAIQKKTPALTNCGKKYPAPVFGGGKCCKTAWLQGSI